MTADQVIRHRTGDLRARALLLFTLFKLEQAAAGFILFTDRGAYCVWPDERKWTIWDAATLAPIAQPEGELLLAFDDKHSVYPLVKDDQGRDDGPAWAEILAHL